MYFITLFSGVRVYLHVILECDEAARHSKGCRMRSAPCRSTTTMKPPSKLATTEAMAKSKQASNKGDDVLRCGDPRTQDSLGTYNGLTVNHGNVRGV